MNNFKVLFVSLALLFAGCSSSNNVNDPNDTKAPLILSVQPSDGATKVPLNSMITATFEEAMDPSTITAMTFQLLDGSDAVEAVVTYEGMTASLQPVGLLLANKLYTAEISTDLKDLSGNALAKAKTWSFTTATVSDEEAPVIDSTFPLDGASNIPLNSVITVTFDEAMDPSTIKSTTILLLDGSDTVEAVVTYEGVIASLKPVSLFLENRLYRVEVSTNVKDLSGNALADSKTWSFTTVSIAPNGPAVVNLGSAGNYALLAKSSISATGATAIVGDVGLSPASAAYITGFDLSAPPSVFSTSLLVTGVIHASDYDAPTPTNLTTAVLDMQTAYTDAAGRELPDYTELGAGSIDGLTLTTGLYKWGTGVSFPNGITIKGGSDDVWIFQIAQDLTVGNGAAVTLEGGAKAENIFWQVAGQTTIGTTAAFQGIILCQTLIEMNTGSSLNGRALAQTAITLDATAVTTP